jgi:hypothetical protein
MRLVVVAGALANKPGNGGAAWTRLSWTLGFRQLGYAVVAAEQVREVRWTKPRSKDLSSASSRHSRA